MQRNHASSLRQRQGDVFGHYGFYADISRLQADREYTLELKLPALKPGQFQGVFFENVEPADTDRVIW